MQRRGQRPPVQQRWPVPPQGSASPVVTMPESKAPLWLFPASGGEAAFLFCAASRLRYRIEGDVPVLLIEEAERMDERATAALVERARGLGLG